MMIKWRSLIIIVVIFLVLFFSDKAKFFDSGLGLIRQYIVSPLTRGFIYTGEESVFLFRNVLAVRGILAENIFLKNERDFFRAEYFKLADVSQENDFLRQALSLQKEKNQKLILANILSFDPFGADDSFIIDKGAQDGLVADSPVILSGGIAVGRIKEINDKESRVLLVTSAQSRVTATTADNQVNGVITGSASGALTLDLVLKEAELKTGQIIQTSGLDGIFQKGLLVGEVSHVYNDSASSFQKAAVQPFFNLRDLKQVFVIVK